MRVLLSLITLLICLGALSAQGNQQADADLVKAVLAESALKIDEALAQYDSSISNAEHGSSTFWKAAIGRVRCLTKLKRWKEARSDLDGFTSLNVPDEFQKDLQALHAKVADASPDAMEKRILDALRRNDSNSILQLGEQVRPVIIRILQQSPDTGAGQRAVRSSLISGATSFSLQSTVWLNRRTRLRPPSSRICACTLIAWAAQKNGKRPFAWALVRNHPM